MVSLVSSTSLPIGAAGDQVALRGGPWGVWVLASMRRAHRNEATEASLGRPCSNFAWNLRGLSKRSQASEELMGFFLTTPSSQPVTSNLSPCSRDPALGMTLYLGLLSKGAPGFVISPTSPSLLCSLRSKLWILGVGGCRPPDTETRFWPLLRL